MEFVTQILTYCRGKEMAWHGCHIFSSSQCCSASLLQSTNAFWPIIKNTICCQVELLLFLPVPSMMMIAFITFKSSLVPLLEGL